jgi:TRAP-type uncharacterized transport system fused permease subunit
VADHSAAPDHGQEEFSEHGVQRRLGDGWLAALNAIALAFSTYQLIVAAFHPLSSLVIRSLHVGFLLCITFILYPAFKSGGRLSRVGAGDTALAFGALALSTYHWVFEAELIQRSGDPSNMDLFVGTALVILTFEATRRILGLALPIVCGLFLIYGVFGQYLPRRPRQGRTGESRRRSPPRFMGMISGSGVANVVTVGQFTIPLMKRFGYKAAFAGGVEATASMGGQIMPPVMGAVAFIMAETLGVAYSEIAKAAIIPAILYFASAFWMVHLEAGRLNLVGLPKDKLPSALGALKERWPLLLPLAMLVYLLFAGFTPLFAGAVALALTVVIILGTSIAENLSATALRYIFWIVLGLICSALFSKGFEIGGVKAQGVDIVLIVVAALIAINFAVRGGRETLVMCRESLAEGARQALPVGVACAIVGIVIGTMTLTGVATIFGGWVVSIGQASIFASLVLTMLTSLVLGMGIPTIPTYIITSSLAAPALLKLGVPLIVSHMFVFYFGIIADLTPPVALAAFAAAPIAKESGFKIGFQAVRIAMAGFVIPYVAVYDPALMLQGGLHAGGGHPAHRRNRLCHERGVRDLASGTPSPRHDMSLCLAAGAVSAVLAIDAFTLSWTHLDRESPLGGGLARCRQRTGDQRGRASAAPAPAWSRPPARCCRTASGTTARIYRRRPFCVLRIRRMRAATPYARRRCAPPLADRLPGIDNSAVIELRACPP